MFPILLMFFQALSTLEPLFLPRQNNREDLGNEDREEEQQEELKRWKKFLASLCLSRPMFTHEGCPTNSSVAYCNQYQGTKHSTADIQNTTLIPDKSK